MKLPICIKNILLRMSDGKSFMNIMVGMEVLLLYVLTCLNYQLPVALFLYKEFLVDVLISPCQFNLEITQKQYLLLLLFL